MSRPIVCLFALASCMLFGSACAHAAPKLNWRQQYERTMIRQALKQTGLKRDPHPVGKRIAKITVVRFNVIAPFDPWPNLINIVHVKSREALVRQELLVKVGDPWKTKLVQETERNLRALQIFSTARTVACRAKNPKEVILLVITKDLWSLRISTSFGFAGSILSELGLYPNEMNLAGWGKQLGLIFSMRHLDLSNFLIRNQLVFGQYFYDPRLFGTRLRFYEEFSVYLDGDVPCGGALGGREDAWCPTSSLGQPNGFFARLFLDRPLYALAAKWSFAVDAQARVQQVRSYILNDPTRDIPIGERPGLSLRTVRFRHFDGDIHSVPRVYDSKSFTSYARVTYSTGYKIKHDLSFSVGGFWYDFRPPGNFPFDDHIREQFVGLTLPKSESGLYVSAQYSIRSARFIRMRNVHKFALTEDFSIGPSLSLSLSPTLDLQNPSQQYITMSASGRYIWNIKGNIFYVSAGGATRWQPHSYAIGIKGPWLNNSFSVTLYNITPVLLFGRLFARAQFRTSSNNIDNATYPLGTSSGLRGIPDGLFAGQHKFLTSLEFRTLPLNIWTLHIGLVAFYDGGAVWGGPDPNEPSRTRAFVHKQSLGVGVRTLFPQFTRSIVRIDLGIPLQANPGTFASWLVITFDQAF